MWPSGTRLLLEPVGEYSSKQHQGRKPETTNTPSRQPDKLQHQRKTQHRGGTRSRSGHNRIRERGPTPSRSFHLGPHGSHSKQGTAGSILADFSRRYESAGTRVLPVVQTLNAYTNYAGKTLG